MAAIKKFHLDLMSAEIHFNAYRDMMPNTYIHEDRSCFLAAISELSAPPRKFNSQLPDRPDMEVRLATAMIYILSLAATYQLDIGGAFKDKIIFDHIN